MIRSLIYGCLVILLRASPLLSQSQETVLRTLREAGVPEVSGNVPVFYSAQARERAVALQKSLLTAHDWYQQQLGVHERIALILWNPAIGNIIADHNNRPHSYAGIVIIPETP